ncbi:MAG: flavodoxin domain-containing protein [Actinoplanes sp.]
MTVLVAYGTTGGGTGEIAGWIAEELRGAGLTVDLIPAGDVGDVSGYRALILGSAVYAAGWQSSARHFAKRFAGQFTDRPVWLFSSGPLDTSADQGPTPPGPHAQAAMAGLPAHEHVTFGGRMTSEARGWLGFVARRAAREGHAGDFRNPERVRSWARDVAATLTAAGTSGPGTRPSGALR